MRHNAQGILGAWAAIVALTALGVVLVLLYPQVSIGAGSKVLGIAVFLVIIAALIWVPRLQIALWKGEVEPEKTAELENSARDTLAKIIGGLFFLGTLYFTWQSLQFERHKETASEFTRAIDQLGSEARNVRVGGVYTLEQVAETSPEAYQWTVAEILAAFVRHEASWGGAKMAFDPHHLPCGDARPHGIPVNQPEIDIQAALEVIGRRQLEYIPPLFGGPRAVNLTLTDLRGANLSEANLRYAALTDSTLVGASLAGADLRGATLRGVDLACAFMPQSKLQDADLSGATLGGADLDDATGLTCSQIMLATTDQDTILPSYLKQQNCGSHPNKEPKGP